MAQILVPTPLRKFTNNLSKVEVNGGTIVENLKDLAVQFPDLEKYLFSGDEIKGYVKIFLGDNDIDSLNGADTEVNTSDIISIIPAIAGGKN